MTVVESRLAPELTALRATFLVAAHHGLALSPDELPAIGQPDMVPAVVAALTAAGLEARAVTGGDWAAAIGLGTAYPALALRRDGSWLILVHAAGEEAIILDPATEADGVKAVPAAAFMAGWSGTLLLVRRPPEAAPPRFGLGWFIPAILAQKRLLAGVAVAALAVNLIGFATPLLMQVLIDKVVPHQAWNTLVAVIAAFLLLTAFEAAFGLLRARLMLLASNRIDGALGQRTFAHLLALPMAFFEAHPAGVLVRHLQQAEKLRHFLTGRLFQVALDAALLPVLLVLLAVYSGTLTLVVLGFSAAIALVIGAMVPAFRARLNRLYAAEADRQAHLVETLAAMRAVKSLAIEPARGAAWDRKLAAALVGHDGVGRVAALGNMATTTLERLMQLSVMAGGAMLVFAGELSMGALVAFTMLSGRVTAPLVQIVAMIHEYQEAALSVRMLGTVMDTPPERPPARAARPAIQGQLTFQGVTFRYPGAAMPALQDLSFTLEAGQVMGVVGRSGSGKTTVTRLVQAIATPQSGLIQLDGIDLRQIDLGHLRRHVGVVLQDNLLFRGTIRENIAAARPMASIEEVVAAARLAGAEEFITRLPGGYDTPVEEGASNFSGGQRQRLAIARALITRPPLLIFDEATSALDPESESIIQQNLASIAAGRSLLIVSHRLASLVAADRILVLDRGRALDCAPHAVLLERCEVYRHLWQQQVGHLR
jgi:ATP-binding cassette subfamily B protein